MTDNVININNHTLQTVCLFLLDMQNVLNPPQMVKQPVDACVKGTLPTVTNYPVSKYFFKISNFKKNVFM